MNKVIIFPFEYGYHKMQLHIVVTDETYQAFLNELNYFEMSMFLEMKRSDISLNEFIGKAEKEMYYYIEQYLFDYMV